MDPLSLPQQSIYLDALLRGPTTKFNMGGAILIRGAVDPATFKRSLETALAVHDVQRMRLHRNDDTVMQEFLPAEECHCPFETLDFSDRAEPLPAAMDWVLSDFGQPMCARQSPFHRDVLIRLGKELHLWYPKFHHLAYDAYGHSLIAATVAESYTELLRCGRVPGFARHCYAAFLQDDRDYAASEQFLKDGAFWRAKFPEMPQPLPFTARKGELAGDGLRTERYTLGIQRALYDAAMNRASTAGVTPFHFLLAGLFAYLNRIGGCDDIVIGTPILNRSNHAFRRTAGMFMNMMPLRIRIGKTASIFSLAQQIKAETRSCYRHQRFPLGETLRHCRPLDGFCHGIFDVTVVYRKLDYDITFGGAPIHVTTLDTCAREETLSLEIDEYSEAEDVNLFFNYNPQLISPAEAEQMAWAFETLLLDVATEGDRPVRDMRILRESAMPAAAAQQVIAKPNLIDLVERWAAEDPDAAAVVCGEARMTRGALDRASNCIASFLVRAGAVAEAPVGVLCGRDAEWIAAMLGVLKAGCAYLPLDPEMPRERLQYILRHSGCTQLLCASNYRSESFESVTSFQVTVAWTGPEISPLPVAILPHSLAYIIYTSGTTGEPKGVLIEHGSLANTIHELLVGWQVTPQDCILEFAAPMFDASIVDIFLGLASGASLVIPSRDVILDPARFVELLRSEQVTVATLPPAYLNSLGTADLTPLRLLITAGEAPNPVDVARHIPHIAYVNAYGPTETAVCAGYFKIEPGTDVPPARIPIGKPIGGTVILVLDEELRPLPIGAAGELFIGGAGLARGYLNDPSLTAERFVRSPLHAGERLYRTGDLGRRLAGGDIEFLGRADAQVKVRGYRVELSEIESVLRMHPAIEAAVVTASGGELVAYLVPRSGLELRELRRFLALKLPAYMMPARWMRITTVPLNASGKVDRDALPDAGGAGEIRIARSSAPPRTPLEKALAGIWEEVLEIEGLGVEDDFFELGGHSLKAIRVLSRVQHRFGVRVELAALFANPTVSGLAACVAQGAALKDSPIPKSAALESYPLSNAQSRIWVLAQLEGGLAAYNMPLALHLEGALDEDALERALRAVIARHESLRTCFVTLQGTPRQMILPAADIAFHLHRCDLSSAASPMAAARLRIQEEFAQPFNLAQAPLLRTSVIRVSEHRRVFALVLHHIVADGWSLDVLLREVSALYAGFATNTPVSLPGLSLQYRDYSQWMTGDLQTEVLHADRDFWMPQLDAPLPVLNLPADYTRPAVLGFTGEVERFPLPRAEAANLRAFSAEYGVSAFMVGLTAVFALLHRYTGDEDIIIGTPVANRERMDLEGQVGLYLNTLALRVRLGGDITLSELLARVRTAVIEAQQHQSYPFDHLIQDLKVRRSTNRNPLFDVMVLMQGEAEPEFRAPGIRSAEFSVPMKVSVFDLTFHFSPSGSGVRLNLEYNTALFERARMERLSSHLDRMLEAIVASPGARLDQVDLLPDEERRRLLREFSEGAGLPTPTQTVIDRFTEQALRTPQQTAVVFEHRSLSYRDLSAASARLACRLRSAGMGRGAVVALVAERSERMVAGVIGIMASGAACLPIDASQPAARIRQLLEDGGCQTVVSDASMPLEDLLPVLDLREDGGECESTLVGCAQLSDAAYITYTSGSSGTPKGSVIEHGSLANLAMALGPALYVDLPQPARELLLTSIGFDVAMKQIFGALTRGNTLVVAGDTLRNDPGALMAVLVHDRIQLLDITPSHFAVLLAQGFAHKPKPDLKAIVLGSEALSCKAVLEFVKEEANRHVALFNFYGPSECTVETLSCKLDQQILEGAGTVPIGRPLANTRAYVLSPQLCLVPIGIPGEICLGGAAVGRGYLNRPQLTEAKFVEDPYHAGELLYRTGDRGRWTADGQLEFLGRQDRQLKIRGYRIEPGELEHHLMQNREVTGAVAAGLLGPSGNLELVAWYTAAEPFPAPEALRAKLRLTLPHYMIPARLVALTAFPLRPNGKVDLERLPDPWAAQSIAQPRQLPQEDLEREIQEIWERVLGVQCPAVDAGFFDAGGNSLQLAVLHSLIEASHPGKVKLMELFSSATIRDQARLLSQRNGMPHRAKDGDQCLVSLTGSAARSLFCFATRSGTSHAYYRLAQQLSSWKVYGVNFVETAHPAAVMADALMEAQPKGGFLLLGYSMGGSMAYETAVELEARGRRVRGLLLLDTWRRLEPFRFTDDEYQRSAADFLTAEGPRNPEPGDTDKVLRRIERYDRYVDSRTEDRPVQCPIRLIEAEGQEVTCPFRITREGWAELTSDFRRTAGAGPHLQMLDNPYLVENARILNDILDSSWGAAQPAERDLL